MRYATLRQLHCQKLLATISLTIKSLFTFTFCCFLYPLNVSDSFLQIKIVLFSLNKQTAVAADWNIRDHLFPTTAFSHPDTLNTAPDVTL